MGRGKRVKTPTASLDYAALDKPLTQGSERQPPNRRRTAADVLKPVCERVLAARASRSTPHRSFLPAIR